MFDRLGRGRATRRSGTTLAICRHLSGSPSFRRWRASTFLFLRLLARRAGLISSLTRCRFPSHRCVVIRGSVARKPRRRTLRQRVRCRPLLVRWRSGSASLCTRLLHSLVRLASAAKLLPASLPPGTARRVQAPCSRITFRRMNPARIKRIRMKQQPCRLCPSSPVCGAG